MKREIGALTIGLVMGVACASGIAYARSGTRTIDVEYNNIKVYKDNVLCDLKDSNGSTIEPFIFEGTTYMPVRGTANLADMQVTWDGATNSVYLWDNLVPSGTFLMEVAPPYNNEGSSYISSKGEYFEMAGERYSNGITLYSGKSALFNLNGKYSSIECTVGHLGSDNPDGTVVVSFIVDGKSIKDVEFEKDDLPKKISIPVGYGLQLKILTSYNGYSNMGIGNITVN